MQSTLARLAAELLGQFAHYFPPESFSQLHELRRLQSLGQAAIELNERAS